MRCRSTRRGTSTPPTDVRENRCGTRSKGCVPSAPLRAATEVSDDPPIYCVGNRRSGGSDCRGGAGAGRGGADPPAPAEDDGRGTDGAAPPPVGAGPPARHLGVLQGDLAGT